MAPCLLKVVDVAGLSANPLRWGWGEVLKALSFLWQVVGLVDIAVERVAGQRCPATPRQFDSPFRHHFDTTGRFGA